MRRSVRIDISKNAYIAHPNQEHWLGTKNNCQVYGKTVESNLTEIIPELEDKIAENIFDWWISGKSYAKWYADKFQQTSINFDS